MAEKQSTPATYDDSKARQGTTPRPQITRGKGFPTLHARQKDKTEPGGTFSLARETKTLPSGVRGPEREGTEGASPRAKSLPNLIPRRPLYDCRGDNHDDGADAVVTLGRRSARRRSLQETREAAKATLRAASRDTLYKKNESLRGED